ncbi:MAG: PAS domain S-box protein [Anaerolineales bacterium]|uniref:PAS domain S-box protein n=1 Tax=Candidatus Villigracilis vicinus TaxID=3140679 RepID=UPI003134AC73|nr:PAS domain S-box protein [Anaerolineales bacterium]
MVASESARSKKKTSLEAQSHEHYLLLALSRAAQSIQQARTAEDFYLAVGREIQFLGGEVTLLLLTEDQKSLSIAYTSYSETLIRKAEKLTGLSLQKYRLPLVQGGIYEKTLCGGRAVFVDSTLDALSDVLPKTFHPFIAPLVSAFDLRQGVLAPLRVDNEVLGLLKVNGSFLKGDDVPAMDSFAGHIAAGLYNVRLMQQLQEELAARKQVEEALRGSQSTFEGIFNSVTETIYIQDENSVFLDVNTGAEKLYGYPREYFIGRTPEFLSAPGRNDLEKVADYVKQAFNGQPVEFEYWGIKKDGTIFPKEVRLTPGTYFGRQVVIAVARDSTERKKAEGELRASEAKIHALLSSVPDMMFVLNRTGDFMDYYAPRSELLFVPPAVFLGKNIRNVMPEEMVNVYFLTLEQVLITGESQLFEYSFDLTNGRRDFEAHVAPYQADNFLCVVRDVTERKQAEQAVRQAEKRFKALIENAPDGIALVGLDGRVKYVSPAARAIFDYEGEEYSHENPLDFIHPDDVGTVLEGMSNLIADPAFTPTFQYRYMHKDGSYRWVESTFSNQFAEPGVEAVVINFRDISLRKEMEKALSESEKYYRSLIENATDGILVVNSEGKISYESPSVAHLLGYGFKNLIGMNSFDLIHPDDLAEIFETFMSGLEKPGHIHRGEYRLKHHDGEWRVFEIVSHYLMDDPAIMGIIINGRDITKIKQAEENLRQQNKNLQSLYQITATLNDSLMIEEIYYAALNSLQTTLKVDRVSILLFDADGVMRFKAWHGLSEEYRRAAEGHSPWKQDVVNPQPVLVADAQNEPSLSSLSALFEKEGIGALGFIPLTHQGRLLGKFMLYFDASHVFLDDEVQLAQTIASHVAFAINRKQIEDALRTSEERYRALYEDNPSMYFTADEHGLVLSVNQYGIEQLGFAPEELVGHSLFNVFHPEDREFARRQITTCLQKPEQLIQLEVRKLRKDGSMLWVRESARAVRDLNDRYVILVVCNDVTEEIKAQEALADSEAELRALFASMRDTVLVIDRNGYYRSVAPTNPERYYIQPEDVVGRHLSAFFPTGKVAEFLSVIEQVLTTGESVSLEYEIILKKQQPWFEAFISPMGADTTIWVARDITERKKIESALISSEQAYRVLFENMPIGLYRTSVNGDVRDANPALLRMFGYVSEQKMLGKKAWNFYRDPIVNDKFMELISKSGSLSAFESEYTREDGTTFWAEDHVRIVHDKNGMPEYYEGSLIDITDRKLAEANLKEREKQYRLLAERVADVVWVLDLNTMKFKYVSPSIENLLGYTAEELIDMSMEDFVTPAALVDLLASYPDRVQRFLAGDTTTVRQIDQVEQKHKNGSVVCVEISSTFTMNENAEPEAIGVSRDITRRKEVEDELRRMNISLQTAHKELQQMFEYEQVLARTDGLTRLYNRRYFFELAIREFNTSLRYRRPLTIILFDIDGFKTANDAFGHSFGDEILTRISKTVKLQVRDVDILARYGGDEFTILLPETNSAQAFLLAERIRAAVDATHVEVEDTSISVTLSLGVAEIIFTPCDKSIEDVIRRADQALYKAKYSGRNHTEIFSVE